MAKISSAVQAVSPFTVAVQAPMPTGPRRLVRVTFQLQHVAGDDLPLEAGVFHPAEQGDLPPVLRQGQDGHRPHLGQRLQDQHAGHDVLLRGSGRRKTARPR